MGGKIVIVLVVQRLNMDNSWLVKWDDITFLLDPWLSGTEIDGFSWFNEQWHATPPISYSDIQEFDLAIISQGYPDHCHLETLEKLGNKYPIIAVPSAHKKLKGKIQNPLYEIPKKNEGNFQLHDLEISRIIPNRPVATFNGLVIRKGNEFILHAPHGGPFSDKTLYPLNDLSCKCLITTFTLYELPFFLGGKINPGKTSAEKLIHQLSPQFVLNTHDENKPAKGISNQLAKRVYPNLKESMPVNYTYIDHYNPVTLI